ncbi:outer membrane protein (porin) [Burkholderia sp. Ch1-1]|uniref:Outer membrane protein (Porin) n=1 Tax=Paraburkholderia dioscoreae TaxID=2604047 RepID=A0A5Q4ZEQ5_9BURK|nr:MULTISPECIES: porin [Paraburkholderia]EIF30490.1 outer membrane protein (porin) [Burkholderia sp. Ch1-1]MDR8395086.1 porin [Paraburkholderia sp. USG1]VVD29413.1 Outer membrane protein (Porin) [Paraburkholderia dioscoreae]
MKNWVGAVVAFGWLASATDLAHAQSSVALYGLIDEGYTYVSNIGGHSSNALASGIAHGDRWGLRGTEDLGGGLSAIFDLEGGFNLNTGATGNGGAIFGRQAWVGLQSQKWGAVTAGDQYDIISDYMCDYNVGFYASGYGIHEGDIDRMECDRLPNAVKYTSPRIGGFKGGIMYSFSNVPGSFHTGSAWEVGGSYIFGPLHLGLAWASLPGKSIDPYGQLGTPVFFGQTVATVTSTKATDLNTAFVLNKYNIFAVGGSYKFGKVTVMANFTNTELGYHGMTSYMHVFEGGAIYNPTPAWGLIASAQHDALQGHAWNQVSAGVQYYLSKRTTVYVSGDYIKASAGVNPELGWFVNPSLTNKQMDARLGITHKF